MTRYSRLLPPTILLTEAVAVLSQFVQNTDPRSPLVYFTVLSGVLAGLVAVVETATRHRGAWLDGARVTTTIGVVVSAIIFSALIAPSTPTGTWFQPWDDVWVRTATVLFHGVAPALVIADLVLRRPPLSPMRWLLAAYSWPLTYLASIALATKAFGVKLPYPFLSPSQMGWGTVSIAITSLAALVGVVAVALRYAASRYHDRRQTT
ncbi:Pr6Pr family membrane protein [Mycobacterium adipatum]|uniref:Pr6Pr family membrane protein n=1 Tax=Mycobacterium adipatum TaxID=1682113 RepID=UPI0034E09B07